MDAIEVTATVSLPGPWLGVNYERLGALAPGVRALVDPATEYVTVCMERGYLVPAPSPQKRGKR